MKKHFGVLFFSLECSFTENISRLYKRRRSRFYCYLQGRHRKKTYYRQRISGALL